MYYKILKDGKACHGGTLDYSLPVEQADGSWRPGELHICTSPVVPCKSGFHVTKEVLTYHDAKQIER